MKRLCSALVLVCFLTACVPQGDPTITTATSTVTTTTAPAPTSTVPREWWRLREMSSDEIYETVLKLPLQLYANISGLGTLEVDHAVSVTKQGTIYGVTDEVTYHPVLASQPHIDPTVDFSDYGEFRALMETVFTVEFVDELLDGDAFAVQDGKLYYFDGGRGVEGTYESTEFRVKSADETCIVYEAISTHYPREEGNNTPWTVTTVNTLKKIDGQWLFDEFSMWH